MEEKIQPHTTRQPAASSSAPAGRTINREPINLWNLWLAIRKRIWSVLCATLIGACIAADFTYFMIPAQYTSSSLMLVLTKETTLQSVADLQLGTSLTGDYTILIQSRPVLEQVIENLGLNMGYQTLKGMTTVTNQSGTRILEISVQDTDPKRAKAIVDELSNVSAAYIGDKMEITPPKIIEEGNVPTQKTSPNNRRNTLYGAAIGLLAALAIIALNEILNDTLNNEEDVTRYLGLVTLAIVPEKPEESGQNHRRHHSRRRKKRKEERA